MPIFIAKNYDGRVESIVLAKNEDLANAYWQGMNIFAHSTDVKSEEDLEDHPTGVLPILKTKIVNASKFGQNPQDFLTVRKG